VVALVGHDVALFELGVATEVFGFHRPEILDPGYRLLVVSADEPPIRVGHTHFSLDGVLPLRHIEEADTIVIPAWSSTDVGGTPIEVLEALRSAHARGVRILTVCSGAFLAAEAGVLDGLAATTHWLYTDLLAERYPKIEVEPGVLYVDAGQVMTSAGTAAGIDLCLHVVRQDHGAEVANAIARRMVVPPQRDGGQAQYADAPVPCCADDDPLAQVLTGRSSTSTRSSPLSASPSGPR
jgi:AraC family transcriptional activator FtrA